MAYAKTSSRSIPQRGYVPKIPDENLTILRNYGRFPYLYNYKTDCWNFDAEHIVRIINSVKQCPHNIKNGRILLGIMPQYLLRTSCDYNDVFTFLDEMDLIAPNLKKFTSAKRGKYYRQIGSSCPADDGTITDDEEPKPHRKTDEELEAERDAQLAQEKIAHEKQANIESLMHRLAIVAPAKPTDTEETAEGEDSEEDWEKQWCH